MILFRVFFLLASVMPILIVCRRIILPRFQTYQQTTDYICGTYSPYDDVLIMADPYDVTDHSQDGYYLVPLARFFEIWREGPCTQIAIPYEQPFVTACKD